MAGDLPFHPRVERTHADPAAIVCTLLLSCNDLYPLPCKHPDPRPECTGETECPVEGDQDGFLSCSPTDGMSFDKCPDCAAIDGTCPIGCEPIPLS